MDWDEFVRKHVPDENTKSGIKSIDAELLRAVQESQESKVILLLDEWDKTRISSDSYFLDFLQTGRISVSGQKYQANLDNLIIFFQTRRGTDRISRWLTEHGQDVQALHSDLRQSERSKALEDFKAGKVRILTATDLASRGLDISNVTHVINYDVPQHSEDYIHRIGRTGRARTEGEAFTLFAPEDLPRVEAIERLLDAPLPRKELDGFSYREAPDEMLPASTPVSRKRNRGFGNRASFGARRRK